MGLVRKEKTLEVCKVGSPYTRALRTPMMQNHI